MTAELFIKLSAKIHAERLRLGETFNKVASWHPDSDEGSLPYYSYDEASSPSSMAQSEDKFDGGAKIYPQSPEEDLLDLSEPDAGAQVSSLLPNNFLVNTSIDQSMSLMDGLPPAWHARQLQNAPPINTSNPYSILANVGEVGGSGGDESGSEREATVQQWLPGADSSFWDLYVNRLRVNASEGGLCDLKE